jgi:FAD dependent oxidoreductase TIGR03364
MSKSAIVIGAGIVGLATAKSLAEKGYKVTVFERNERAVGASIRNFGMVWPVGQPFGILYERALRSRAAWKKVCEEAGIWYDPCGSLLSAYHPDEMDVIREFADKEGTLRPIKLLNKEKTLKLSPATNPAGLLGALWSETEIIVDPRQAIADLPHYLQSKYGISFHFNKAVSRIEYPKVYSGRDIYEADHIFVCSGAEFETLYPEVFADSGITKCKLQMLRTKPQPDQWKAGPALSAGLTLTHYGAFQNLTTLSALNERYNRDMPEYVKWGIHVMISQNELTEVTIGDSHEYGLVHDPFDRQYINGLIMEYLKTFVVLKDLSIGQTWNGIYPKLKGKTEFVAQPESGVTIINGLSGAGMTLSFGLAEEVVGQM